jgi:SIR2-like domain
MRGRTGEACPITDWGVLALESTIHMTDKLNDKHWKLLLTRIKDKKCTPFIGAGACHGSIPVASEIARTLAAEANYPLSDVDNLSRVTQYIAVDYMDPSYPKEQLSKRWFDSLDSPDFDDPKEPHGLLADLELPLYLTTNYDDFMFRALKTRNKAPVQKICRWNELIPRELSTLKQNELRPANPVVFHLHGAKDIPESMVVTEDDYLDFMVTFSRDDSLIPHQIRKALTGTSLLFVGYSINDLNFRVLYRSIVQYLKKSIVKAHISVQLAPQLTATTTEHDVTTYLSRYFRELNITVYWGTANEFATELRARLEKFTDG